MARAGDELVNPITCERIVFRKTAAETGGALLEMDDFWMRPGHRAPAHAHPGMRERWEVIAGMASFAIGGVEQRAGPGHVVVADPGVAHQAWNATAEPVHLRIEMCPALQWETFVERLFALAADAHSAGHQQPDPARLLELMREFPREIALMPDRRGRT
ncbi:MAG TPA: cupin domain-containing protein [Solirubrobacteraceae bacterium]